MVAVLPLRCGTGERHTHPHTDRKEERQTQAVEGVLRVALVPRVAAAWATYSHTYTQRQRERHVHTHGERESARERETYTLSLTHTEREGERDREKETYANSRRGPEG